jgi:hypothetical protein
MTPYDRVIAALKARGSRRMGKNWQCPSHDDRHPSLSVSPAVHPETGEDTVLIRCHAGCGTIEEILPDLGLEPSDLFTGNGHRQGQLFPASRYSPVGLDILVMLPPGAERSFMVTSALGRFVSISGGREHVFSQRQIGAVIVEAKHRKAAVSVLGISSYGLANDIVRWKEWGVAHGCSRKLLTIFVRKVASCPVCKTSLVGYEQTSDSSSVGYEPDHTSSSSGYESVPKDVITDGGFFKGVNEERVKALKASQSTNRWEILYPEGDGSPKGKGF